MRIAVVASNYPWRSRPYCGTFVRELVWEWARQGHTCEVVAPISIWNVLRYGSSDKHVVVEKVARSSATVRVARPLIVTASARRIGPWNTEGLSDLSFALTVNRELHRRRTHFDVVYAHFFYPAGLAVMHYARKNGVPCFVAHGDDSLEPHRLDSGKTDFEGITGVVAVSRDNAAICKSHMGIPEARVAIFPNGVDHSLFYPHDRIEARRELGLPTDVPLVAFVGRFSARKGPDRVLAALDYVPSAQALMIGEGPIQVNTSRVAFRGFVDHEQMPRYLSAADMFVLPTTGEGSCNALLEAMACGLPVVTSAGSFNDDVLGPGVGIRIDPMNIAQIGYAIRSLVEQHDLRATMSKRCLEWSKGFAIQMRAASISKWIQESIEQQSWPDAH